MAHLSHRFLMKPKSLTRFFSGLLPISDTPLGKNIEEDWEIIEILDEEEDSSGEGEAFGDDKVFNYSDDHYLQSDQIKYRILSKAEVLQYLEDKILRFSSVFLLSTSEATTILHHFKWNVMKTEDEWLTNEDKVRKAVGLFKSPVSIASTASEKACGICHENFPGKKMLGVSCGHQFCRSCWTGYISKAICNGPGCLTLRCPDESCDASVGWDLIKQLSSEEEKKKFEHYIIRSCLLGNLEAKWCPAPGCEHAVFLISDGDDSAVTCRCSYRFCWNCTKEVHTPVDCDTVDKWMSEISVQLQNQLLVNTEPCQTYSSPVQQNQGRAYSEGTNCGFISSRIFGDKQSSDPARDYWDFDFKLDESSRPAENLKEYERDIARESFQRYIQFYEGWISNESSRAKAAEDLKMFQKNHLEIMCGIFGVSEKELNFMVDAQLQLVECHQLLKWTYVYGYFMSEGENNKKCLFEFMQEQAKHLLGQLKKQVEELDMFLYVDVSLKQFRDYRRILLSLTRATKEHYDKMMDALRAGLPEVASIASASLEKSQEERNQDNRPSPSSKVMREEAQFDNANTSANTNTSSGVIKSGNA